MTASTTDTGSEHAATSSSGSAITADDADGSASSAGLVSVIIPTFRDEEFLPRALRSVETQTYRPIEAIVVDSNDSDRVRALVDHYRFAEYLYDEPGGPAAARNAGIEASDGAFIALLDADDEWLPRKTERQIERLEEDAADFVYSAQYHEKHGRLKLRSGFELPDQDGRAHVRYFAEGGGIGSRTVLFRRECFEREQFWEELEGREDPNLWVRFLAEFDATKVDAPLAIKHSRPGSLSSDKLMMAENELRSIEMLVDRYPELTPFASERKRNARYDCAKAHLRRGDSTTAKIYFQQIGFTDANDRIDVRASILFLLTLLPVNHSRVVHVLGSMYNRFYHERRSSTR